MKSIKKQPTNQFLIFLIFLLIYEFFVCFFIISKVKFTEIDYKTYLQQITVILNGQFDYNFIRGSTGLLGNLLCLFC